MSRPICQKSHLWTQWLAMHTCPKTYHKKYQKCISPPHRVIAPPRTWLMCRMKLTKCSWVWINTHCIEMVATNKVLGLPTEHGNEALFLSILLLFHLIMWCDALVFCSWRWITCNFFRFLLQFHQFFCLCNKSSELVGTDNVLRAGLYFLYLPSRIAWQTDRFLQTDRLTNT